MNQPIDADRKAGFINLTKSLLHNLGVVIVGFGFALLGRGLDWLLGVREFDGLFAAVAAWLLLVIGFLLRVWATYYFYRQHMKVISLVPQKTLITSGPYRFSRNPVYLGGNVFIFLGAVLLLGSPSGVCLTAVNVIIMDLFIRREEEQLERDFGDEWVRYRSRVRRWF
jgi:protein-S-isoprenylcysteine O-methyltransferase Ste14